MVVCDRNTNQRLFYIWSVQGWYERVQQHQVVTLRQVVIPWFEHIEYLKKNDTQARSIRGGLGGSIPLLGFSRFWICFQMFIYILFGSRLFNESTPFTLSCRRTAGLRD